MNSSFLMALGRHDGGKLVENADDQLKQCVSEVNRYGGRATLTITMTLQPNGETGGGGLELTAAVKTTMPKRPQGKAFYYVAEDDSLSRTPPKDHDLFEGLRAVEENTPKKY